LSRAGINAHLEQSVEILVRLALHRNGQLRLVPILSEDERRNWVGTGRKYPNGEYEPLGRGDFSIDACERVSLSLGTAIDATKGSVRPQIDFANGERQAARVPPMCDVFGLSPGLEDHSAPPLAGVIPACVFLASAWVGTWLLYPNWLTSLSEHTSSTATGQQAHRETAMISRS